MKPSFHKYHWAPDTEQIVPPPLPRVLTLYKPLLTVQVWGLSTSRQRPVLVIVLVSIVSLDVCKVPVVDAGLRAVQAEVEVQPVLSNPDCLQLRVTVQSLVNPVKIKC